MANPQTENGHTQIANEILEALARIYLPPNQWQVLLCVIRKTYGFKKKTDWIANSQICEATGLVKSTVSRALIRLANQNIISRHKKAVGLQKDWERWKVSRTDNFEAKVSSSANSEKLAALLSKVSNPANKKLAAQLTTKETTKETNTKERTGKQIHGEFANVLLTDQEYTKLKSRYPRQADRAIEEFSAYITSRGKRYKDHYATLLNWIGRDEKNGKAKHTRTLPKLYTPTRHYADG